MAKEIREDVERRGGLGEATCGARQQPRNERAVTFPDTSNYPAGVSLPEQVQAQALLNEASLPQQTLILNDVVIIDVIIHVLRGVLHLFYGNKM